MEEEGFASSQLRLKDDIWNIFYVILKILDYN